MEAVFVWTMLYWRAPEMLIHGGDEYAVRASSGYFKTEQECWDSSKVLKNYPTMRFTCAKTAVGKDELARSDESSAKATKALDDLARQLSQKYAPIPYGPYPEKTKP